jgi:hypothetical protein
LPVHKKGAKDGKSKGEILKRIGGNRNLCSFCPTNPGEDNQAFFLWENA